MCTMVPKQSPLYILYFFVFNWETLYLQHIIERLKSLNLHQFLSLLGTKCHNSVTK